MGKKVNRKKTAPLDMIHFRPGAELGSLIGQLAEELAISRGETAKRLAALAIRGFDLGFYGLAEELTQYLYGSPSFDEACDHMHVAVQEITTKDQEIVDVPRENKLDAVRTLLNRYRVLRNLQEEVEKKRLTIKVHRTNG